MNTTMTTIFKKNYILTFIISSLYIIVSFGSVHAESISGDDLCGSSSTTRCELSDIKDMSEGILKMVVGIGLPLLIIFIMYRFIVAYFALRRGNANAYKEELKNVTEGVLGFLIILFLFGGLFLTMLRFVGVTDFPLQLLKLINGEPTTPTSFLFTHAYAEETGLPSPLVTTGAYEFLMSAVRLLMRFFVYPALIVIWVITGFSFVSAQGNPEKIKDAKKWFLGAFLTTAVMMLVQVILLAIQGSVEKIVPSGGVSQVQRVDSPLSLDKNKIL